MAMLNPDRSRFASGYSSASPADNVLEPLCAIRTLDVRDAAAIERLLGGLDFAARSARFGWIGSDAPLVRPVDGVVGARHTLGLFVAQQLAGCIEIYRENPFCAEAALVVDPQWRRRGFGRALLDAAISWGVWNAVATIRLTFSRHNWPMRRLVADVDAHLDIADDEICAEIAVAEA
jgi:GNAT superfamily N-acetyltransferase